MNPAPAIQTNARMTIVAIIDPGDDHILQRLRSILPESAFIQIALPSEGEGQTDIAIPQALPNFTERQRTILSLLAQNLSNKEIGRALAISHFTVRNHVSQILRLLNVRSRKVAVATLAQMDGVHGRNVTDMERWRQASLHADGLRPCAGQREV